MPVNFEDLIVKNTAFWNLKTLSLVEVYSILICMRQKF